MRAQVILGAGFGDEGKGRWVDALAHAAGSAQTWVVRFNSSAQAGHTVQTPQGQRHVFHQVGSGSFAGAATYMGPDVAIHPMLLGEELAALAQQGVVPRLAMAPTAPVTVPYDVLINQAIETARGQARHGSCGVGFGETIERHQHPAFALEAQDLAHPARVRQVLDRIRRHHVPARLAALGLPPDAVDPWRLHDGLMARFWEDAQATLAAVDLQPPSFLASAEHLIFEGAQGLGLDMDLGCFPHVTRSHTGLPQVLPLARAAGVTDLAITYATRAYQTRHGAGPLPGEQPAPIAPRFADATNVPNPHQGALRFAPLDVRRLIQRIQADRTRAPFDRCRHGLAVSCLDQMGPMTPLSGGAWVPTPQLARLLAEEVGGHWAWEAWGPTRSDTTPMAHADGGCYTEQPSSPNASACVDLVFS